MDPVPVNLAIEDPLSEAVLRRLLAEAAPRYAIGAVYGRMGFGYLKKTVAGWNQAAKGTPFVILTDLDKGKCPPSLIEQWLPHGKHPNLIFSVAVREVEAWLLADSLNCAKFLGIKPGRMPPDPDHLGDAKAELITLARASRLAEIRTRLVPRSGSTAMQGPDYNDCLSGFVATAWDIEEAAQRSPSLAGTVRRLNSFRPLWP